MQTVLRPARPEDFDYCEALYFSAAERSIAVMKLDRAAHSAGFRQRWDVTEVRIITLDGRDIGWLQTMTRGDTLFLGQLFVAPAHQRRGIGTEVMNALVDEATVAGQAMTLGVVKTNPALELYRRLGFQVTHDDDRKFYMRRNPAGSGR